MPNLITDVEDLRKLARRRVPKLFYDYVDGGSWSEQTYRANERDLAGLALRQRVGVDVSGIDIATSILGLRRTLPLALAPAGLAGMLHADGEIRAARAAEAFGVPFTLSTVSICSIEDVAERVRTPFWFQLYVMKDRQFVTRLIDRARAANCSALMLTLDLPIQGRRHKDTKNGLAVPPRLTAATLARMMARPRWCAGMLRTPHRTFGNIVGHAPGVGSTVAFAKWVADQFDRSTNWEDVRWIRKQWSGKLIVKGLMDATDARLAIDAGADAIVVSNHGGRQLDGAPSSISALAPIVDAVDGRAEVFMDGGIRSGQDIVRALALGADAVMIGRAYLYGLGALGEAGVTRCLELMREELESTMTLCGVTSVAQIGAQTLAFPSDPSTRRPQADASPRPARPRREPELAQAAPHSRS